MHGQPRGCDHENVMELTAKHEPKYTVPPGKASAFWMPCLILSWIHLLLFQVFLQHLTPLLSLSTFTALWLTILEFMDKYMHADKSDLLVSSGIFQSTFKTWGSNTCKEVTFALSREY